MQTVPPQVTVITPLYNSSAFIGETLNSLKAQTFTNWESILIDDGSTDDTADVVKPYVVADPARESGHCRREKYRNKRSARRMDLSSRS
jgi:glycosyltransferase involved in cell wall biosynthesis